MEPQRFISHAVRADDHDRWHVRSLKSPAPLRDQLTVTGEDDRLRWLRRDVHRDLSAIIVGECLDENFARERVGSRRFRRYFGEFIHAFILTASRRPSVPLQ